MQTFMKFVACGILLPLCVSAAADDTFCAGAATADLTPGEGVSLDGPISKPGPVRGVHDPLTSRALVLQLGDTSILIVVNDMCLIDREVYDAAKKIVHDKTGIPISHQLMAATHSHATPRVVRISTRPPDEAYRLLVAERIAEAAVKAFTNLAPAKVGFGTFSKPGLAACRRSLCKAGSVGVNPFGEEGELIKSVAGKSDAVIGPAGPVDPDFSVLSVQHADGRPLALLGNLSVHYCGGYAGGLVSADYFGCYARRLESKLSSRDKNAPFVGIMSNATSGDIGSFRRTEGPNPPWSRMEHFGNMLADESLELLRTITHQVPKSLNVITTELPLSVRKPDAERVDWASSLVSQPNSKGLHRWSRIYAQEALQLHEFPDRYDVPLQVIRVGDIGIAAAPCEVFSETGLAIKADSPFPQTMTMELANGYSGYLPSEQQHHWGGYETWPARSSHLEVAAESRIRKELLHMLKQLLLTD
ncbi:MAG TPA: hypothetical protein EYG03_30710 [Planctomycetes bacterium]|nr:hypothetical protein [Fuerstiella sp.]HIK96336.1 hypothetical protein [Planctomycetota bacterium]